MDIKKKKSHKAGEIPGRMKKIFEAEEKAEGDPVDPPEQEKVEKKKAEEDKVENKKSVQRRRAKTAKVKPEEVEAEVNNE